MSFIFSFWKINCCLWLGRKRLQKWNGKSRWYVLRYVEFVALPYGLVRELTPKICWQKVTACIHYCDRKWSLSLFIYHLMLLVGILPHYFIVKHIRKCLAAYWQTVHLINLHYKSASDCQSYILKHWIRVVSVDADFCGCCLWENEWVFLLVWELSEVSLLYCWVLLQASKIHQLCLHSRE